MVVQFSQIKSVCSLEIFSLPQFVGGGDGQFSDFFFNFPALCYHCKIFNKRKKQIFSINLSKIQLNREYRMFKKYYITLPQSNQKTFLKKKKRKTIRTHGNFTYLNGGFYTAIVMGELSFIYCLLTYIVKLEIKREKA